MSNNEGWIKIHRQITECSIWEDNEPFDRRSAWIDLILMANHKDKTIIFDGKPLVVKRGQRITSIRELSERWGWYTKKTIEFLKLLETLQMITKESDKRKTLLTIVKYDVFQFSGNSNDNSDDNSSDNSNDNSSDNSSDIQTRNEKNDKNDNIKEILPKGNIKKSDTDESQKERNDYQGIINKWNEICVSYPKATSLSEARKKAINARLKTYTVDDLINAFSLAEESDFLKGKNDRNWSANFDWIIKDTNLAKVLDGNYKNKNKGEMTNENSTSYQGFDFSKFG